MRRDRRPLGVRDALIGTELAGHRIEYLIGRGGGGSVYLAEHLGLGRRAALKVLPAEMSADETFRRRFISEARTAATLRHPGIVTVFDAGEADGLLYISMLHVPGTDLARVVATDGPMDPAQLLPIVSQIADALDAAHERGFVHRDVKPANILIEHDADTGLGRAYLSDFGIAKPFHSVEGPTRTGEFVGTIDYVAPEQIRGEPLDGRADQYSLACVVVEGLTGEVTFPRELGITTLYAHLGEPPPSLHERRPDLPLVLDAAVGRGLSKDREERYETCGSLIEAVREACDAPTGAHLPNPTAAPSPWTSGSQPKRRSDIVPGSPTMLGGERKRVTVMSCDLVDPTAHADRVGPDAMRSFRDAFFERMTAEMSRHGGTITEFLESGFIALFGAPLAHEDHARRATLAAWSIQEGMRTAPIRFPEGPSDAVAVRIGLNTGSVVVGKSGDELRMEYTAIGDTSNLAVRLRAVAEPGTVVLSDSTRKAAGAWIRTTPLVEDPAAGTARDVNAFRLDGVTIASRGEASRARPMVGRDRETAAIDRALRSLQAGVGGLVLVAGEAGIGKSRLIAEVDRSHSASSVRWLEGRATSFGETTAYWPFLELIRASAGVGHEDEESEVWEKVRARLAELFPDALDEILPYIATLLGLRVRDGFEDRIRYLNDRAMGSHVLFSCRRFFEALALEQPTVLAFEDVHWMDRASLELLEHILPLTKSRPILILATARAGSSGIAQLRRAASVSVGSRVIEIGLEPLDATQSARLLEAFMGPERLSTRETETIVMKAGGNPLFLDEVIRSLVESGRLAGNTSAGDRRGNAITEGLAIPDTIRDVIVARVDRIGAELKETLAVAAVIGRVFSARVLEAVVAVPKEDIEVRLAALRELDLVVETRRGAEREHAFKHALVQEAVYQTIVPPRRRELHLRVGTAIESVFPDRLEEFYSVLAHHFAEAKDWERAQAYLFRAGDEASRVAADSEALAHYERALESHGLAFGESLDRVQRAALERKIGDALFRLGRHDQAIERLLRSLENLGHTYPTTPRAVQRAIGGEFVRHALYRRTPAVLRRKPRSSAEAVEETYASYRALLWMHYFMEPVNFGLDVLRLLNIAERSGLRSGIAQGSAGLGMALDVVKRPRLALGHLERAIEIAEELDHPIAKGDAYLGMGVHEFVAGNLEPALSYFTRSQAAYRKAGDLRGWGVTRTLGSWIVRLQGRFDASLAAGADALQVATDAGDDELKGWALEDRARTLCMIGLLDEAIELCQEALEVFRSIPAPVGVSDALADLGFCYLRRDELDRAGDALGEAGRLIEQAGVSGYNATYVRWYLADYHLSVMERSDRSDRADAMRNAARACRASIRNSRAVPLGVPGSARSRGTFLWLRGRRRSALRWWGRSVEAGERIGIPWQVALTELDAGRLTGDHVRIERARTIFTDLGADLDAARASEALLAIFASDLGLNTLISDHGFQSVTRSIRMDHLLKRTARSSCRTPARPWEWTSSI